MFYVMWRHCKTNIHLEDVREHTTGHKVFLINSNVKTTLQTYAVVITPRQ